MNFVAIFLLALGFSADAFAVSVCKGLSMKKCTWRKAIIVGLYFGIFQAGMPLIGYFLGTQFSNYVRSVDHWIAFGLLCIIGISMVKEAFEADEECCECQEEKLDVKTMLGLAIATSIDALAGGVAFAMQDIQIIPAVTIIGITTFVLSVIGVKLGKTFGSKYQHKAEIIGGCVLILMGIEILLEDLKILPF